MYKLFPLAANGGLGKTFEVVLDEDGEGFEMTVRDAMLAETIEKLMVMHDAGAHPTEILGLDECGDYLIAKQPLALPFVDLDVDRASAIHRMRAVPCKARFKRPVWIIWMNDGAWVMSDLHSGNIMREPDGNPCIIDALLAPLPPSMIAKNRLLSESVEDARVFRETGVLPKRKAFDDVHDDEL